MISVGLASSSTCTRYLLHWRQADGILSWAVHAQQLNIKIKQVTFISWHAPNVPLSLAFKFLFVPNFHLRHKLIAHFIMKQLKQEINSFQSFFVNFTKYVASWFNNKKSSNSWRALYLCIFISCVFVFFAFKVFSWSQKSS